MLMKASQMLGRGRWYRVGCRATTLRERCINALTRADVSLGALEDNKLVRRLACVIKVGHWRLLFDCIWKIEAESECLLTF